MDRFAERGHEVVVLTSDTRLPDRDEVSDGHGPVRVERALKGWWDWRTHGSLHAGLRSRMSIERHNQRVVEEVLSRFRPDVASVWSLVYMSFTVATRIERAGVPLVVSLGDDSITYAPALDEWTRVFARRPWLRPVGAFARLETRLPTFSEAKVTAASAMIRDSVSSHSQWHFQDVDIIPMGIETHDFPFAEPHPEPWNWRLLFAGRLVPEKGIATAIRAMTMLPPQARLELDGYGAPEMVEEMARLARQLGVSDRVHFRCSARSELAGRYRQADVVVYPSEWPEPFGLVPLEAMACGTPVVATGTGGSAEFLTDGENCLLFQAGDAAALAACVSRLADDAMLRRRIAEGGAGTARLHTLDRYAERLLVLHHAAADQAARKLDRARGGRPVADRAEHRADA
jgi:glycosyltransferase involved in cell wall biosynthesis